MKFIKNSLILYEVVVLQAGDSVLIDDSIDHGNISRGLSWDYSKILVICECNGAENAWGLIGRVLACPSSSVYLRRAGYSICSSSQVSNRFIPAMP
jgi:hypothetical protein